MNDNERETYEVMMNRLAAALYNTASAVRFAIDHSEGFEKEAFIAAKNDAQDAWNAFNK